MRLTVTIICQLGIISIKILIKTVVVEEAKKPKLITSLIQLSIPWLTTTRQWWWQRRETKDSPSMIWWWTTLCSSKLWKDSLMKKKKRPQPSKIPSLINQTFWTTNRCLIILRASTLAPSITDQPLVTLNSGTMMLLTSTTRWCTKACKWETILTRIRELKKWSNLQPLITHALKRPFSNPCTLWVTRESTSVTSD